MIGETNLATLLRQMTPHLHPATFVFCTLPPEILKTLTIQPRCTFQEAEGMTLLVTQAEAEPKTGPTPTRAARSPWRSTPALKRSASSPPSPPPSLRKASASTRSLPTITTICLCLWIRRNGRSPASKPSLPPINPPCCRKTGDAGVPTAVEDFHSAGWLSVTLAMANP